MSELEIANDDGQRNNFPLKSMEQNKIARSTNICSNLAAILPFVCTRNTFFEPFETAAIKSNESFREWGARNEMSC